MGNAPTSRARLVLAGCALALACACGDRGPSGEQLGETESALFSNDQAAFDFFVGKGLTNFQAAGIVGNLDQESGVNPNAVQYGGGPGRGIAQWSVGGRWDTDSNDNAVWYAGKQGQSVWSLQLQLEFIWYELTTFSGYGLGALKASTNVTDATIAFQNDFEGCGACNQSGRIAYAQAVLNAYGTVAYGAQFVSQSFPLATTTLTMTAGEVIPSYIELKNTGSKSWDSNTRIGTTQPRDRTSAFADSSWIAPDRPAGVSGTVAPGGTYKFNFDLAAPNTPGTYDEFFGVVEEGVTWFSAPGQGGPADNDLEVKIVVLPNPDAGASSDAGTTVGDGGVVKPPSGDGGGGPVVVNAGCSVGPSARSSAQPPAWAALLIAGFLARRRKRPA